MGATTKMVVYGVKQGIKYSPAIAAAVRAGKGPALDFTKAKLEAQRHKRLAVDEAHTLKEGTLLRIVRGEDVVWVVFSGDHPVSAHPAVEVPVADLVGHADLDQRRPPEHFPTTGERAKRVGTKAARTVRLKRD